jgi:hypothetical protein
MSAAAEFLCKHAIKLRILSRREPLGSLAVALRTKIMALHAATVEILVEKAKFEPKVALGVAEAIELAMTQAQFVTVPILDARLHEVRAEIRVLEGKLDARVQELKADMQRLSADVDAKLEARFAKMETRLAEMEAKLVRWVFLVMLGNVALSLAATTVLNALKTL